MVFDTIAHSYPSCALNINNTDWYVMMKRSVHGEGKYEFILRKPAESKVLKCSFYLLSHSPPNCIKLENKSAIATKMVKFEHSIGDMTLICAFNVESSEIKMSPTNSEHWLATKTLELKDIVAVNRCISR